MQELSIESQKKVELINITEHVRSRVNNNTISDGICIIYIPHTTAAIIINEDEAGLLSDIGTFVESLAEGKTGWKHDKVDQNTPAHLANIAIGCEKIIPIQNGKLMLGTWQSIFFLELDGPKKREIYLEYIECKG
jgi:secondary thiamine-phosphate synthase enzyme